MYQLGLWLAIFFAIFLRLPPNKFLRIPPDLSPVSIRLALLFLLLTRGGADPDPADLSLACRTKSRSKELWTSIFPLYSIKPNLRASRVFSTRCVKFLRFGLPMLVRTICMRVRFRRCHVGALFRVGGTQYGA